MNNHTEEARNTCRANPVFTKDFLLKMAKLKTEASIVADALLTIRNR